MSKSPVRPRCTSVVLAGLVLLLLGIPTSVAYAAGTCSHSLSSHRASISLEGNLTLATIERSGNRIQMNGVNCQTATVRNTNLIVVNGAPDGQALTVDLTGGPFAPGFSRAGEASGSPAEIEIQVDLGAGTDQLQIEGASGGDKVRFGSLGVNINGDDDRDVTTITGVNLFRVYGNDGNDSIAATGGKGTGALVSYPITVYAGSGADVVTGGKEVDELSGQEGADTISGGGGDHDQLYGNQGNDKIFGGPGDDNIFPEGGNDSIFGGPGDDGFFQDALAEGADTFSGGPGVDLYDLSDRSAPQTVDADGVADDGLAGEHDNVKPDVEEIRGGSGNDKLTGSGVPNQFVGNEGADILNGLGGDDLLEGNDQADTLNGGSGEDELFGDAEPDTLRGGAGDDELTGGLGNDFLFGDADNDWLFEGSVTSGADKLHGGSGAEDRLFYSQRTIGVTVTIGFSGANDGQSGEGDEVFGDIERVDGGSGSDTLLAEISAEIDHWLFGNGGTDTLFGGDGQDILVGGPGGDNIAGEEGNDRLIGQADNDTINADDNSYDFVDGGTETDTCYTDAFDFDTVNCEA